MAITRLDTASSAAAATLSFSVSAGTDRLLVVCCGDEFNGATSVTGVDYGGQAMTQAVQQHTADAGFSAGCSIWYLLDAGIAAASGSTITPTYSSAPADEVLHAASYAGVDQTGGATTNPATNSAETNAATPNPVIVDLTETDEGLVIAVNHNGQQSSTTWNAAMTEQTDTIDASSHGSMADRLSTTSANVDIEPTNALQNRTAACSASFAPATGITSISPSEFDMDAGDVDVNSTGGAFDASNNTVYISDADTLAGSANEVDISSAINTESTTLINLDLTQLSSTELDDLQTLGPGARFVIVETASDEYSISITLHRPQAIEMSLSSEFAPGGTTAQLTAPSGKTTGDFGGGRIEEAANPSATSTDLGADEYREDEWCIQANTSSREVTYEFRVLYGGEVADTITVTPKLTIQAGGLVVTRDVTDQIFILETDNQQREIELLFTDGMDFFDPDSRDRGALQLDDLFLRDRLENPAERNVSSTDQLFLLATLLRGIDAQQRDQVFLRGLDARDLSRFAIDPTFLLEREARDRGLDTRDELFLRDDSLIETVTEAITRLVTDYLFLRDERISDRDKQHPDRLFLRSSARTVNEQFLPPDFVFLFEARRSALDRAFTEFLFVDDDVSIETIAQKLIDRLVTDRLFVPDEAQRERALVKAAADTLFLLDTVQALKGIREFERSILDSVFFLTAAYRDIAKQELDLVFFAEEVRKILEKIVSETLLLNSLQIIEKGKEIVLRDHLFLDETQVSEIDKRVAEQILFAEVALRALDKLIDQSVLLSDSVAAEVSEASLVVERAVIDSILLASQIVGRELAQGRDVTDSVLLGSVAFRDMLKSLADRLLLVDQALTQKSTQPVLTDRVMLLDRLRTERCLTGFDRLLLRDLTQKTRGLLSREGLLLPDTVQRLVFQSVVDALIFALIRSRDFLGVRIATEENFLGALIDALLYAETSFSRWRKDI